MQKPTKLTKRFVERLEFDGKPYVVRDTTVRGLLVAVNAGSKSWKVQRDMRPGLAGRPVSTIRHTLGRLDELDLDAARTRAQEVIAGIKRGIDPNGTPAPDAGAWSVERSYQEYVADLRIRDGSEENIQNMIDRLGRLLPEWKALSITAIKPSMARDAHARISRDNGKRAANQTLKEFRAVFNFVRKVVDDPDVLPPNPVGSVTFNKERRREAVILPEDLPAWWAKLQALSNPLRRLMHELGLFSGLRPGNLVSIEREWIKLDVRAIVIPKTKAGRSFALPLSEHMVGIVTKALALSKMQEPTAPWLFPTRDKTGREVIRTQVWKERELASETGHILRHTHRTYAKNADVPDVDAELLIDHTIKGVQGVYLHDRALFARLQQQQEKVTRYTLGLINP